MSLYRLSDARFELIEQLDVYEFCAIWTSFSYPGWGVLGRGSSQGQTDETGLDEMDGSGPVQRVEGLHRKPTTRNIVSMSKLQ